MPVLQRTEFNYLIFLCVLIMIALLAYSKHYEHKFITAKLESGENIIELRVNKDFLRYPNIESRSQGGAISIIGDKSALRDILGHEIDWSYTIMVLPNKSSSSIDSFKDVVTGNYYDEKKIDECKTIFIPKSYLINSSREEVFFYSCKGKAVLVKCVVDAPGCIWRSQMDNNLRLVYPLPNDCLKIWRICSSVVENQIAKLTIN